MSFQARRHVFKSGPAKDRAHAECTRGGEYERGMPPLEGDAPSRKGGSGDVPRENFDLWVPLMFFMLFGCVLVQNSSSVVLAEIFGQNNI